MKPRQQRMLAIGLVLAGVAIATGLALKAFQNNMMFFVEISDVIKGEHPKDRNFRVGGLVVDGSVQRTPGSLNVSFDLTDLENELTVSFDKVLPDLFREGQGIVAHGRLDEDGVFVADQVLAKHDENYMAPEVADSLKDHAAAKHAAMKAEQENP